MKPPTPIRPARDRNEPTAPPIIEGRVPPHDLDAEAAVLSAVMLDPTALSRVAGFLRPEHFYSEAHRRIYEAAIELAAVGKPTDVMIIGGWLKDRERIAQIGGMAYLSEILNAAPAVANAEPYGRRIFDKARERLLIATCQRISAEGYVDHGEASAWIEASAEEVHRVAHLSAERETYGHLSRFMREVGADLARAQEIGAGGVSGTPTGFAKLDALTTGMHPGESWILAARPGMGKTALALAIWAFVAGHERTTSTGIVKSAAAFASLEMPGKELAARTIVGEARASMLDLRNGKLQPGAMARIVAAAAKLNARRAWIDERADTTLAGVRALAMRAQRDAAKAGAVLKLLVVDYLQLMRGDGRRFGANRELEIADISKGLKILAKELGITVLALAQLNRALESRACRRPLLSDLRESGSIENDADRVIFLYRDAYYRRAGERAPTGDDDDDAELIVAKARNGPTGMVKVRFDGPSTRFYEIPEGY